MGFLETLFKYGEQISFAVVLVLVLFGGFKLVMFLLKMMKDTIQQLADQVEKQAESQKRMAGFLELLVRNLKVPQDGGPGQ